MVVGISHTFASTVKGERTGWSMGSLCSGSPALVHGRPRTRHGLRRRRRQPQRRSVSPTTGATGCSSSFVLSAIATVGHRAAAHRHHRHAKSDSVPSTEGSRCELRSATTNEESTDTRHADLNGVVVLDDLNQRRHSVYNACARRWIRLLQYDEADVRRYRTMAGAYSSRRGRRLQYAPIPTSALSAPLKRRAWGHEATRP